MRGWWMVLVAGGCTPEGVGLELLSALPGEVEGVALDGRQARVGMADQVCDVDVLTGEVTRDLQPTAQRERVLDAWGEQVLGTVPDGLFVLDEEAVALYPWRVVDAALDPATDAPVALLETDGGGCLVAFGTDARAIDELDCTQLPGFAFDAGSGTAWVADGHLLVRVPREGTPTAWEAGVDQVVALGDGAVVGRRGGTRLDAVDSQGERAWTGWLREGQGVDQLTPFGSGVVVMASDRRGGELVIFGADGSEQGVHPLPGIGGVSVDDAGQTLALTTPDATLFYRVVGDGAFDVDGDLAASGESVGRGAALTVSGVALAAATLLVSE